MPAVLNYPGVYIEEVSSGVRTIAGVATSVTAFVGYTSKGEPDKAVAITSFAEFERKYGGLDRASPVSYAVRQFFANGGSQALIVRVASGCKTTRWALKDDQSGGALEVEAASPGSWADSLLLAVDHADVHNSDAEFNLLVSQQQIDGKVVLLETHRNLCMNEHSAQFAPSVVNNASTRIRVKRAPGLAFGRQGFAVSGSVAFPLHAVDAVIAGTLDGKKSFRLLLQGSPWADMAALVAAATMAITAAGLKAELTAAETAADGVAGSGHLQLKSAKVDQTSRVTIATGAVGGLTAAIRMGLANGGREFNADAEHRPAGVVEQKPDASGADGTPPGAAELMGSDGDKSGLHALRDAELFNLLVVPETFGMSDEQATSVIQAGVGLCEERRAFYIVDAPSRLQSVEDIKKWAPAASLSRNAAIYFPAVKIADPLDDLRMRPMAPSGTVAGVYARTDATRGVWKAPAGTDATLNGVVDLALNLDDRQNGQLNPEGVNVLRSFPAHGRVVWGARTMKGSDKQADEYKYIPVRRLALFIEESLYRGTQWVVFEPNDEPLWAQIRLNVGAFMHNLFRQGAFQGRSPREAYFVKCDRETTIQNDIDLGIVNIHVGFAPLKPAEFVVIRLQQMAGQVEV